jgi:hypothetical protein
MTPALSRPMIAGDLAVSAVGSRRGGPLPALSRPMMPDGGVVFASVRVAAGALAGFDGAPVAIVSRDVSGFTVSVARTWTVSILSISVSHAAHAANAAPSTIARTLVIAPSGRAAWCRPR